MQHKTTTRMKTKPLCCCFQEEILKALRSKNKIATLLDFCPFCKLKNGKVQIGMHESKTIIQSKQYTKFCKKNSGKQNGKNDDDKDDDEDDDDDDDTNDECKSQSNSSDNDESNDDDDSSYDDDDSDNDDDDDSNNNDSSNDDDEDGDNDNDDSGSDDCDNDDDSNDDGDSDDDDSSSDDDANDDAKSFKRKRQYIKKKSSNKKKRAKNNKREIVKKQKRDAELTRQNKSQTRYKMFAEELWKKDRDYRDGILNSLYYKLYMRNKLERAITQTAQGKNQLEEAIEKQFATKLFALLEYKNLNHMEIYEKPCNDAKSVKTCSWCKTVNLYPERYAITIDYRKESEIHSVEETCLFCQTCKTKFIKIAKVYNLLWLLSKPYFDHDCNKFKYLGYTIFTQYNEKKYMAIINCTNKDKDKNKSNSKKIFCELNRLVMNIVY